MQALLADLEDEFGPGKVFRPYRDVRFSADKTPYKLTCAAHLTGGYVSVSADELFVGSGLYMPMPDDLKRFRAAIDADRTGAELERIVATLRKAKYDVGAHDTLKTAPRGYPKDHPRIELLQLKGIVMSKSWPVGGWLGTKKAKDRVVTTLEAARPLNAWLADHVGARRRPSASARAAGSPRPSRRSARPTGSVAAPSARVAHSARCVRA